MRVPRVLSPAGNPTGLAAAAFALWTAGTMIWHVAHHHGAVDPQVIATALAAVAALLTRPAVTPVSDPRIPGKTITDVTGPSQLQAVKVGYDASFAQAVAREVMAMMAARTRAAPGGGYRPPSGRVVTDSPLPPPANPLTPAAQVMTGYVPPAAPAVQPPATGSGPVSTEGNQAP